MRACATSGEDEAFKIVSEKKIFERYQTVYQRDVLFPTGKTVSYDVLGNCRSDFTSVFVFPFNTKSQSVTLLREYSPGKNKETLSFVAGMFEKGKHRSIEEAARAELSEEAFLTGGKLIPLVSGGVSADKYSLNHFHYFLALDCVDDESPGERDEEEWITVVRGVSLSEVRKNIEGGELNTPNSLLGMLALDKLRGLGFESSLRSSSDEVAHGVGGRRKVPERLSE